MSEPPRILPVFPLTGVVLLPLNWLPLHVFEPRYRAMVEDAAEGDGFIGMIQPLVPEDDNSPDSSLESSPESDAPPGDPPRLYPIGCAGRIERCERQPDGRFVILLRGVSRFRVREELAPQRGYRRVEADYREFTGDLREAEAEVDPAPALEAALALGRSRGFELDLAKLAGLPGFSLVNGLTAAMPLSPAEKQALIEAADPRARQELLIALLEMNAGAVGGSSSGTLDLPPTLVN